MKAPTIIEPEFAKESFTCPFCKVCTQQTWINSHNLFQTFTTFQHNTFLNYRNEIVNYEQQAIKKFLSHFVRNIENRILPIGEYCIALCSSCEKGSIWLNKEMIYPRTSAIENPNDDLEDSAKQVYEEARDIVAISPRAAAALLRLCLQMLCKQVGEKGDNLSEDIQSLLNKGAIDKSLQKAFDSVRVIGNNAVHPGEINIDERKEDVHLLFKLINMIATKMITDKKEIDALYGDLPKNQKRKAQS